MKHLKTVKETEAYIHDLELQIFKLKKTHAYRVGMAIMNYYNKPGKLNLLGLYAFTKELLESTKKKKGSTALFNKTTKVMLSDSFSTDINKSILMGKVVVPSKQHYFLPHYKSSKCTLTLEPKGVFLTPNNFAELVGLGNFDEVIIDLALLEKLPVWRGFGTYDDIARTNKFLNIMFYNKEIKKILIDNGNLILFPILIDRLDVFNEVLTVEGESK